MRRELTTLMVVLLLLAPAARASVTFNEIGANPRGSDADREWIELRVANETNMTGWILREGGTDHGLSPFQGDEVMEPGLAVIADDAGTFINETGFNGTVLDSSFSLRNGGEPLALVGHNLSVNLTYPDLGQGETYCRRGNWALCSPTPGLPNINSSDGSDNNSTERNVSNPSGNVTDNGKTEGKEVSDPLAVLSHPTSLQFGSHGFAVVRSSPGRLHAYGYPSQVLGDGTGDGVEAGDAEGRTSVRVTERGTSIVPLIAKDNCGGNYEEDVYRIRIRLHRDGEEVETEDLGIDFFGKGSCTEETDKEEGDTEKVNNYNELDVRVVDIPQRIEVNETFTVRSVLLGNGSAEVYSYMRDGRRLVSEGRWTGNKRDVGVSGLEYVELNLTPEEAGNFTLVVRARTKEDKYDAVRDVHVEELKKRSTKEGGELTNSSEEEDEMEELELEDVDRESPDGILDVVSRLLKEWL